MQKNLGVYCRFFEKKNRNCKFDRCLAEGHSETTAIMSENGFSDDLKP